MSERTHTLALTAREVQILRISLTWSLRTSPSFSPAEHHEDVRRKLEREYGALQTRLEHLKEGGDDRAPERA